MPETDSVSSVAAVISASARWVSPLMSRLIRPTRYVSHMKNGSITSESRASGQLRMNMATTVEIAMARLLVTELAVSVTTACTPPTSFASRLWISPVRVSVKNRSGIRCRCVYSAPRRSCMTFWPMTLFKYDCPTPISPEMIGMAIISPT